MRNLPALQRRAIGRRTHAGIRTAGILALAIALPLGICRSANAARSVTPVLMKETAQHFTCLVANTSGRRLEPGPRVTIVGIAGNVLATRELASLKAGGIGTLTFDFAQFTAYCAVEGRFPKNKVRVSFCVHDAESSECLATVTAP